MKSLEQVGIENVISDKKYLLVVQMYERYEFGGMESYIGTGEEVLEEIRQIFGYEEGGEDGEDDGDSWIEFVEERNGDGDDYVEVFEIE